MKLSYLVFFFSFLTAQAIAAPLSEKGMVDLLVDQLSKRYGDARVTVVQPLEWRDHRKPTQAVELSLLEEDGFSRIRFLFTSKKGVSFEGWAQWSACMQVRYANQKIKPRQPLNESMFIFKDLELTSGLGKELRKNILTGKLIGLESRSTLLEGQVLTQSVVEKIPDIRMGDSVQIELVSGNLKVVTLGVSQEDGFHQQKIHAITDRSRRKFVGLLLPGHVVEVVL